MNIDITEEIKFSDNGIWSGIVMEEANVGSIILEWICVLLFDHSNHCILSNFENRGLWLPAEHKHNDETIASIVQRIVNRVRLYS